MEVYIFLFIIIIFFIVFFGKKINFLLLYLLSTFFYHFPAFFGEYYLFYSNSYSNISTKTYIILIINCLIIFCLYFFSNKAMTKKIYYDNVNQNEIKFIKLLTIINYIILVIFFIKYKNIIFNGTFNKLYVMSKMSRYLTYYMYFSTFWNIYIFTIKTKLPKYVYLSGILSLLFTFILGNRSFIVISIIGIIFSYIHDHFEKNSFAHFFKKHKKVFIGMLIVMLFMFFIKNIYSALLSKNYEVIKKNLLDSSYYSYSLWNSEPNGITRNLDLLVSRNYEYNSVSYIENITLLIPGINHLFNKNAGYSEQSSTFLYGEDANNGSSFLGEAYANGKYIMVIIIVILLSAILSLIYFLTLNSKSNLLKSFFLTLGIEYSFYIARNPSNFVIARTKYYLYSLIILLIIKKIFFSEKYKDMVVNNNERK